MKTILTDLWDRLRTSLWFIPTLMAVASAVLAIGLVRAQYWLPDDWIPETRWLKTGDAAGARQILATIAGSVITVTGVIFSVTLVALSLASQQFGPRLLRTFMRDRGNQFVLGTFIGTFIYSMLVLRVVQEASDGQANIPNVAVTFAVVLALLALGVLIYFIHHVVSYIQAEVIVANVRRELHDTMRSLYPNEPDECEARDHDAAALAELTDALSDPWNVRTTFAGYVRALDLPGLLELADEHRCVISITQRPGKFVLDDQTIAHVHPDHNHHADEGHDATTHRALAEEIRSCVIIGSSRTAEQDIEFSMSQLVEIAVRSLSPSLNDPFTAISCLDRLSEALVHLGRRETPKTQRCDVDGELRLLIDRPDFAGMVALAFDQIRQNARSKPAVIIRMLELIAMIIDSLRHRPACFGPLVKQARMLASSAEVTIAEESDRASIADRYTAVLEQVKRCQTTRDNDP
jgi:uncharacterized membrane protein